MTWKTVANNHFGSSHIFGGNDIDKISNVFNGQEDIDVLDINSNTTIRDDKFKLRNPANTASYIYSTSALTADRTITEPVMTFSSDKPVYENVSQILSNKTLAPSSPFPSDVTITESGNLTALNGDPTINRWGTYYPAPTGSTSSAIGKFQGILSAHTVTAPTASIFWDSTHGLIARYTNSGADPDQIGFFSPTTIGPFRLAKAVKMRAIFGVAGTAGGSICCGIGFTERSTIPTHAGPLGTTTTCLGHFGDVQAVSIEARSGSNWMFHTASGNETNTTFHFTPFINAPKSLNVRYNFEIAWDDGGTNVRGFANGEAPQSPIETNKLPDDNTPLYFHIVHNNYIANVQSFDLGSIWIEAS